MNTKENHHDAISRSAGDMHDVLSADAIERAVDKLHQRGTKPDAMLVFDIYDTISKAERLSRQLQVLAGKIQKHLDR